MAGASAANPLLAGLFGVAAGVAVIVGNANPPDTPTPDTGDKELGVRVQGAIQDLSKAVENLDGAVLGNPGYGPELIPKEAQTGYKFASPAMGVLGDGRWLKANLTEGLTEAMDAMLFRMMRIPLGFSGPLSTVQVSLYRGRDKVSRGS